MPGKFMDGAGSELAGIAGHHRMLALVNLTGAAVRA